MAFCNIGTCVLVRLHLLTTLLLGKRPSVMASIFKWIWFLFNLLIEIYFLISNFINYIKYCRRNSLVLHQEYTSYENLTFTGFYITLPNINVSDCPKESLFSYDVTSIYSNMICKAHSGLKNGESIPCREWLFHAAIGATRWDVKTNLEISLEAFSTVVIFMKYNCSHQINEVTDLRHSSYDNEYRNCNSYLLVDPLPIAREHDWPKRIIFLL